MIFSSEVDSALPKLPSLASLPEVCFIFNKCDSLEGMSELDAKKEIISFLTKLFFVLVGIILLTVSGLISMIKNQDITILFWLGIVSIFILSIGCLLVFKHIQQKIKEIENYD